MIYFTDLTVFVRQIANGSMAIGAVFIIVIFMKYIWNYWPYRKDNIAVRAAIAIVVLTFGHFIRAFSGWLEFFWAEQGWDISLWAVQSWQWFIVAAGCIIVGKVLMILNFAPWKYRKQIAIAAVVSAFGIPLLLSLLA